MININDKYIEDMVNKYPLSRENKTDLRDYTLKMVASLSQEVAEATDVPYEHHIKYNLPVKIKQGSVGACCACAGTANTMIMKSCTVPLSWWFLYADREDNDWQGTGMIPRECLDTIKRDGIAPLDIFNFKMEYPIINKQLTSHPYKDKIFKEAANYKIGGYVKVSQKEVKALISKGIPVMIGVEVYRNFYEAVNNYYIIPSRPSGEFKGRHEMLITGYKGDIYEILNWWDYEWDHELYLDMDSDIITDYYIITDEPIIKPVVKTYTIGWNRDEKGWFYSKDGYNKVTLSWLQIDDQWYYLNAGGYALHNQWVLHKNKWYYLNTDCSMKTGWLLYKNKWYYLDKKNGEMLTGWYLDTDGKQYYLDIAEGWMYSDCKILIDGKYYTFNTSGALVK